MKNLLKMNDLLNKLIFSFILFYNLPNFANNEPPFFHKVLMYELCDACGCSNVGGNLGMGGVIENNFLGIRYLHQQYESKDGIFLNSPKIKEYFNTIQIWSRIPIVSKLEAQVFVPYHFHNREYINKSSVINGLGDINILFNYSVLNSRKVRYNKASDKTSLKNHVLKVGLGVKLPTGKYNQKINNTTNPSFQLGTGSTDFLSNIQYTFKYNRFGVTNMLNYYLKTKNDKKYQFGNQFNFNTTLFYVFKDNKKNALVPSLAISGEFYGSNSYFNTKVHNTEGNALFTGFGIEYNTKNLTFGSSGMFPVNQNLAQGNVTSKFRTSLYINYNF